MEFKSITIKAYDVFTNELIDVTDLYMKGCTCGEIGYGQFDVEISTSLFYIKIERKEFVSIEYIDRGDYSYTINGRQKVQPITKKGLISIKCADEALQTYIERKALDVFDDEDKVKIKLKDNRVIEIFKANFNAIEWYDTEFKKHTIQGYIKANMILHYLVMIKGSGIVIFVDDKNKLLDIIDKNSSIHKNIIIRSFYRDEDLSKNIYRCMRDFFREEFSNIKKYSIEDFNNFRIEKLLPITNMLFVCYPKFIRMDDDRFFLGRMFFDGKDWR